MAASRRRIIVVVVLSFGVAWGCAPRIVRTANSLPAPTQIRASRIERVWIAGFVARGTDELDLSSETARVLRDRLRSIASGPVIDAEPILLTSGRDFADVHKWQILGDELGKPLIVTGTVKLLYAPPKVVQHGPRMMLVPEAGRVLEATVVLIDGRTGQVYQDPGTAVAPAVRRWPVRVCPPALLQVDGWRDGGLAGCDWEGNAGRAALRWQGRVRGPRLRRPGGSLAVRAHQLRLWPAGDWRTPYQMDTGTSIRETPSSSGR